MAAPSSSSSNNCTSTIPKIIKFGYTDFKVLSDEMPPKRIARWKFRTSEKIFINDSSIKHITWTWSHPLTEMKLLLKGHSHEKYTVFFWFDSVENIKQKNIFNTLHHKLIYDERDIWMNKMLILMVISQSYI